MELLPTRGTFAPEEPVEVELRELAAPTRVSLWRLDEIVAEVDVTPADPVARFGPQREGGYGVEANGVQSALDVLANPFSRARYGFVSDYAAGRATDGVADNVRRMHLNAVQFYDWMYRHAKLLPPTEEFADALGRDISLETVRRLVGAVRRSGSAPLGYAAVYAAGREEWPEWRDSGLYRADGGPWTLGDDFLWNVDPTSGRWVEHLTSELRNAVDQIGFVGFHLDQYGAPKWAFRADGSPVDLSDAFPDLIDRLANQLPAERLIFNNVNDFPTWATAGAAQAAVYIEVWPPHDRLSHLAELVAKARSFAPQKSVILAAYLSVYASGNESEASQAERLQLATVASHGGTVLVHGEENAVLTEAYYVNHAQLSTETHEASRRYYDFVVRYGDLLFDRSAVDVTRTLLGGINEEIAVEAPVPVSVDSRAGALWTRVIRLDTGLLASLIDLSQQDDDVWDAPKRVAPPLGGVRLTVERRTQSEQRFLFASPEGASPMHALPVVSDGRREAVELPPFSTWALVWMPSEESR
jgi:dextranase